MDPHSNKDVDEVILAHLRAVGSAPFPALWRAQKVQDALMRAANARKIDPYRLLDNRLQRMRREKLIRMDGAHWKIRERRPM